MVSCPTGALTNKTVVGTVLTGEPVETGFLLGLPYFEEISGTFLNLNRNAVVLRKFQTGEVICREGEYGSTAFYIIKGKADVHITAPLAHVGKSGGATGFFSKLTSFLTKSPDGDGKSIPIDGPVDVAVSGPAATLGPGDLFGEMTCMSLYPRSATVRATEDCVMIEMLRNVLDIMLRNKTLRAQLDFNYRKRALEDHLRSVPLALAGLRGATAPVGHGVEDEVGCDPGEQRRSRSVFQQTANKRAGQDMVRDEHRSTLPEFIGPTGSRVLTRTGPPQQGVHQ